MKWLLNLEEILKDCPKGMELDCTMYDNVTFDGIIENKLYPIKVDVGEGITMMLTKYGQYTDDELAKCVIFPKGETTWEGFVPPHKFKDGDIVATNTGNWIGITTGGHALSDMPTYCVLSHNREVKLYFGRKEKWRFSRLATEEEKQRLFDAIKLNGYKWNAETKTLEKLVEPKFDPKTLKEFDKVLVKDDGDWIWRVDIISVPADYNDNIPYLIGDNDFDWIIPYNEETKHLVGTHEEAPEYYRYWED